MFNVGGGEIIVIALIALIVLGPKRLPEAARQVGKVMGDLRKLSSGFQNEMKTAFVEADDPTRVTARRNVLAKETTADDAVEVEASEEADAVEPVGAVEPTDAVEPGEVDPAVSESIAAVAAPHDPPANAKVTPPAGARTTSATRGAPGDPTEPLEGELVVEGEADVPEPPLPRTTP